MILINASDGNIFLTQTLIWNHTKQHNITHSLYRGQLQKKILFVQL